MKWLNEMALTCAAAGIVALASHLSWQDDVDEALKLIDQNGKVVGAEALVTPSGSQQEKVNVTIDDGKIVIVDKDGTKREIDVSGAKSIIVNKAVQSIIKDGEEERKVTGKAIIVGPNGERQEIELGDGADGNLFVFGSDATNPQADWQGVFELAKDFDVLSERMPGRLVIGQANVGKYMIGVNCKPVGESLRVHFNLPEGAGLIVDSEPAKGTPAADAGIAMHDVLIAVDGQSVGSLEELSEAVQAAGKDDRQINLTLLRRGAEIQLNVKPIERKIARTIRPFVRGPANLDLKVERFGPGLVFGDEQERNQDEIMKHLESVEKQIKAHMEEMSRLQEELRNALPQLKTKDDK
jgi:hypothetical protein